MTEVDEEHLAALLERTDYLDGAMLVAAGIDETRLCYQAPRTRLSCSAAGVALEHARAA